MEKLINIRKGLDIRLKGEADGALSAPTTVFTDYAVKPTDYLGIKPKLMVGEGDRVLAGDFLFFDKNNDRIKVSSPVSGVVDKIVCGQRRVLQEIQIKADEKIEYKQFKSYDITKLDRDQVKEALLDSGLWSLLRQRPYENIPSPDKTPRNIFISCFDSSPLAPDMDEIVYGREKHFQAGIDALRLLTDGKVHLSIDIYKTTSYAFKECKNVEIHRFTGPHPAGNIGVQIHHIAPINKGEEVWYINPQDVIIIGRLLMTGQYDATKVVAIVGSELIKTGYYKILSGIKVSYLLKNNLKSAQYTELSYSVDVKDVDLRIISGNVLTGKQIGYNGYLSISDNVITVIPEGNRYKFMGWITLGFNIFSFSRTFLSWLMPSRKYIIDTNLNGGVRSYVVTGNFEKVFPMNIYPLQLIKACIAKDIDEMENLGIYEVAPEDFALCEYIDPSKTEIQQIIREGLELIKAEMS